MKPGEPAFIHSRCHPEAPTWAVLDGKKLTIECAECVADIVTFTVSGTPEGDWHVQV